MLEQASADAVISNLEWQVIEKSIQLYYTNGSDDSGDGSYMRSLYAEHHAAVDVLIAAREKAEQK